MFPDEAVRDMRTMGFFVPCPLFVSVNNFVRMKMKDGGEFDIPLERNRCLMVPQYGVTLVNSHSEWSPPMNVGCNLRWHHYHRIGHYTHILAVLALKRLRWSYFFHGNVKPFLETADKILAQCPFPISHRTCHFKLVQKSANTYWFQWTIYQRLSNGACSHIYARRFDCTKCHDWQLGYINDQHHHQQQRGLEWRAVIQDCTVCLCMCVWVR